MNDALSLFIQEENLSEGLHASQVRDAWYNLMKGSLKKYTHKIEYKDNILTVYTKSTVFRNELNMTKHGLLEQMNINLKEEKLKNIEVKLIS